MSNSGPRELAWYVLRQFGDLRWPRPGSFYESLVDTTARADPTNMARLALGFPELVRMVAQAQNDEDGMAALVVIAEAREVCPVHNIPDCSPLLNGCSLLTRAHL